MPASLRTTIYLWKCTFIGLVLGLATAWLLSKNVWLDMRMATGEVIPWFGLAGLLLGIYTALRPHASGRRVTSRQIGLSTLLVLAAVPIGAAWGHWDAIAIMPAVLVRQAVHGSAPAASINPCLLGLLVLGVPALFFDPERYCSTDGKRCNGGNTR